MNFYEHTLIARQDISPSQIKQIQEKYTKIIENNDGSILKFESWGLMHLSYLIKKNKKGNYLHFKIKGKGKTIRELEKNEKLDKNKLQAIVEEFIYSGMAPSIRKNIMDTMLEKQTILQRASTVDRVVGKIETFIETFTEKLAA